MEDILPGTEIGQTDHLRRIEVAQETEVSLKETSLKGDIPQETGNGPLEDSPKGGTPPKTEIGLEVPSPILTLEMTRGHCLEVMTPGPTGINPRTGQDLAIALSSSKELRADLLLEAVEVAKTLHGVGQAGLSPWTGPAGPPLGTPERCTPL